MLVQTFSVVEPKFSPNMLTNLVNIFGENFGYNPSIWHHGLSH